MFYTFSDNNQDFMSGSKLHPLVKTLNEVTLRICCRNRVLLEVFNLDNENFETAINEQYEKLKKPLCILLILFYF